MKITNILEEAIEFGRICDFDEAHALQVSKLSLVLFDKLQSVHEMGNSERIWLRIASLMHDVGKSVNGTLHNKASQNIIIKEAGLPFRKRVRKIMGLVARYHRGVLPEDTHKYYRKLDCDAKQCVKKLAAFLRLADALDSEHNQNITSMTCEVKRNRVIFYLRLADEADLRKVYRKADLFRQVFNKHVEIRTVIASRPGKIRLDSISASSYARVA